jgi:16S rRNA (adenine1518-N6/adenine1519-N6)-dimethyltransferase
LPRKLGQHFLIRDSILEQLAIAACGEHTTRVLEIGPGKGALTRHLLPRTDELHALELDSNLAAYLQTKFPALSKLQVHVGDVLTIDLAQWGPAVVIGNLPYYITSPIIDKFLALDSRFETAVFLMQWEVAERLLAKPGTRDYGYLTVATRLVCDLELICRVPPSAVAPPPKVASAGVRLRRRLAAPDHLPDLLRFVGRSFAHKRKTLRNNLRPFYGQRADSMPEAGLRAEQLTIDQFIALNTSMGS